MKSTVYNGIGGKHLLLPEGAELSSVPAEILKEVFGTSNVGEIKPDKSVQLAQGEKRIALDATEAISGIEKDGFYVGSHKVDVIIDVSKTHPNI